MKASDRWWDLGWDREHSNVIDLPSQSMSIGALFVATKVEEEWRSLRDVVNVYYRILHPGEAIIALASPEFSQIRGEIVRAERTLLREVRTAVVPAPSRTMYRTHVGEAKHSSE